MIFINFFLALACAGVAGGFIGIFALWFTSQVLALVAATVAIVVFFKVFSELS